MKRVAILTTFTSHDDKYSLCGVVANQIKMLLLNNIKPTVFVQESGWWKDSKNFDKTRMSQLYHDVDIVMIPSVACHNQVKKDEKFNQDVDSLYQVFKDKLKDFDVCLTHDFVYQPAALKHNVATRKVAHELTSIKWFHWIHSATSPNLLGRMTGIFEDEYTNIIREKFPNSKYVFFNHMSKRRIAENFKVDESDVVIIPHPTDFYEVYGIYSDDLFEVLEINNVMDAEFISIYPCRLDTGKNVEMMIKTMAALKKMNHKVKAIVVDFHSTGVEKNEYRNRLRKIGDDSGLKEDLIFTSETKEQWKAGVDQEIVLQLYRLGNVFVMPSKSESYSLVLQEALGYAPIPVINEDFIPFREIAGPNAIYRQYSSNIDRATILDGDTNTNYSNEDMYHMETAMKIKSQFINDYGQQQRVRVRRTRNLRFVANNYFLPNILS